MKPGIKKLNFTPRQMDVARLVAIGEPIKAIAARLEISPRTVEGFLTSIRRKTGSESTAQAGCKLARLNLCHPPA
jgi:DNA-binding NarL/FixJ family response regulator